MLKDAVIIALMPYGGHATTLHWKPWRWEVMRKLNVYYSGTRFPDHRTAMSMQLLEVTA